MKKFITIILISLFIFMSFKASIFAESLNDDVQIEIPSTLKEAYKSLDEILSAEEIEEIKNSSQEDIILYHFGLGMWIRNNWLRPENSQLEELLYNEGCFEYYDGISHFILMGYHYYLNDDEYTIEMYKKGIQKSKADEFKNQLGFSLLFIFIIVIARFLLRKIQYSIRFFEKVKHIRIFQFLRVPLVLFILGLIINGILLIPDNNWTIVFYCIYIIVIALILVITAILCFRDMTKFQISISAIIPFIYYMIYCIESEFFKSLLGYGIYGLNIFPIDYIFLLSNSINVYLPSYLNITLAFFPFIYVLLAKTKSSSGIR